MSSSPEKSQHTHGRSEVRLRLDLEARLTEEQLALGIAVRALRKDRKWTQEKAAEMIGIHEKHIQRMESGKANVTLATLVALAAAFDVEIAALFSQASNP